MRQGIYHLNQIYAIIGTVLVAVLESTFDKNRPTLAANRNLVRGLPDYSV